MRCTGAHMHPRYNRGATILGSLGKSHGWAYRTVPSGVNNIDNLIGVFQSPKTLIFKRIRLIPTTECSSPTVLIMCRTTTLPSGEISRQFQLNHFHTVCSSRAKAVSICDYHMMCVNILASNNWGGGERVSQVPVLDGTHQSSRSGSTLGTSMVKTVTYKQALANWLQNQSSFQARDGPQSRLCENV